MFSAIVFLCLLYVLAHFLLVISTKQIAIMARYRKRARRGIIQDPVRLEQFQKRLVKRNANLDRYGPSYLEATPDQRAARAKDGYYGRGAYSLGGLKKVYKNLTSRGQRRMIRGAATTALRAGLATATGFGAYDVTAGERTNNVITSGTSAGSVPEFASIADEHGDMLISHREYIGDVYGNSAGTLFDNHVYDLNPGIERTFPWLSQIAQNFAEYEFIQLIFMFRSTVSDIGSSSNGQVGTIIMATSYNPDSAPFSDKSVMMQYAHSNSDKTTCSQLHGVECDPSMNAGPASKYVRNVPFSQVVGDSVRYDQGKFQIAVHGTPSGFDDQTIGELWVSYTVKLNKPKLFTGIGKGISMDQFVSGGGEAYNYLWGNPFNVLSATENGIGGRLVEVSNTEQRYIFPDNAHGYYELKFWTEGNALGAIVAQGFSLSGNVSLVQDLFGAGSSTQPNPDSGVRALTTQSTCDFAMFHVRVLPPSTTDGNHCTFKLQLGAAVSVTQSVCTVTEYNPTSVTPPEYRNSSGYVVIPS